MNPDVCFQCPDCKQRFLLHFTQDFRSKFRKWQYTATCYNWNNWTAWKFQFISFSKRSNVTGQHDRQDERLTGQLPNQSGHCPLTGRYFEPWHFMKQTKHAGFLEVTTITKETGFLSENLHMHAWTLTWNLQLTIPCEVKSVNASMFLSLSLSLFLSFSVIYFFLSASEKRPYCRLTHWK